MTLDRLIREGEDVAVTDVVVLELLAGANTEERYRRIARLLAGFPLVSVQSPFDFVAAADLYRRCRAAGRAIRSMNDCVIAAVAIRTGAELLHQDRDFDLLAEHSALQLYR